jgi:hypothetical protein
MNVGYGIDCTLYQLLIHVHLYDIENIQFWLLKKSMSDGTVYNLFWHVGQPAVMLWYRD